MNRGTDGPTMELHTEAWTRVGRGRWGWVPAGTAFPIEAEYVYTEAELTRALYVYAATTARFMPIEWNRFRLVARALGSGGGGGVVGIHEWCVDAGRWTPAIGAPWVIWDGTDKVVAC